MEAHDFFLTLLIILLTARIFTELATRLQAQSVIGELFAGVVLAPLAAKLMSVVIKRFGTQPALVVHRVPWPCCPCPVWPG